MRTGTVDNYTKESAREALRIRLQDHNAKLNATDDSELDELGDLGDLGDLDESTALNSDPETVEQELQQVEVQQPKPASPIAGSSSDRDRIVNEMLIREAEALIDDEQAESVAYGKRLGQLLTQKILQKVGLSNVDVDDGQKQRDHPNWAWAKKWQPKELIQGRHYEKVWPTKSSKDITNIPPRTNKFFPFFDALDAASTSLLAMGVFTKTQYEVLQSFAVHHLGVPEGKLKSYKVLRGNIARLPVLKLYLKSYTEIIQAAEEGEESTTRVHWCAFHSLFDLLVRVLQFGNNFAESTFLPSMGDYISELHHGRVWRSSPLFTFPWLTVGGNRYWLGSHVCYKLPESNKIMVGQLISLHEPEDGATFVHGLSQLSGRSNEDVLKRACERYPLLVATIRRYRQHAGHQDELIAEWGVEDQLLGGDGILSNVRVEYTEAAFRTAKREELAAAAQPQGVNGSGVEQAVYLCQYADVSGVIGANPTGGLVLMTKMPTHPMEQHNYNFGRLGCLPLGVPILRIFLTLYIDSFGAYQRLYRSTSGVYVSIGNLPMYLQQLLRNILQFTLCPPGMPLDVACETMYEQIRELQNGVMVYLGPKLGWNFLVGGVGIFRTDTIDGQKLTGHLACTSDRGCRLCKVWKSSYADMTWDAVAGRRTMNEERVVRDLAAGVKGKGAAKTTRTGLGLGAEPDVFTSNGILANYINAFPYDIFHSELLGVGKLAYGRFTGSLTKKAQVELAGRLDAFPMPPTWRNRNFPELSPTEKSDSLSNYQGKEMAKLVQIFPFLVVGWLQEEHFTTEKRASYKIRLGEDWLAKLTKTMVHLSQSCCEAFLDSRPSGKERAKQLHDNVTRARDGLVKAWPHTFDGRSNTHNGLHMVMAHLDFACRCVDVRRFETTHGRNRKVTIRQSNNHEPEVDMQKGNAVRQSVEFWVCGGYDHCDAKVPTAPNFFAPGPDLVEMFRKDKFMKLLMSEHREATTYAEGAGAKAASEELVLVDVLSKRQREGPLDCGEESAQQLAGAYDKFRLKRGDVPDPVVVDQHKWVEVRGRPRWRRRIEVGETWEVHTSLASGESTRQRERRPQVALVEQVFAHTDESGLRVVWVLVAWYVPCATAPHAVTDAPFYQRVKDLRLSPLRLLPARALLRPVHVLSFCNKSPCDAGRHHFPIGCPGSDSEIVCLNPFFVK
jgi:hypothetical protein